MMVITDTQWKQRYQALISEVHVYSCAIHHLDFTHHDPRVTAGERARAAAFRQSMDARRFLTGLVLSKLLLASYVGCDAPNISINAGPHNKPVASCVGQPAILMPHFNISHSGQWVVVALASDPVGVDVEEVRDIGLGELADAVFSPEEYDQYQHAVDPLACFYKFWTGKEALLKALGLGLIDDLKQIDISRGLDHAFAGRYCRTRLQLESFTPAKGYQGAVCYAAGKRVVWSELPGEALTA